MDATASDGPRLPGRAVTLDLPGRGRTWARDIPGPPGAPTVVLLHGWTATADLNWFACYGALSRRWRVIAPDHRGHGRGLRSSRPFRLADCADDAIAAADLLGAGPVVVVGYSMGGPIAQLAWKRHPSRVRALVLCATARTFGDGRQGALALQSLGAAGALSRLTPRPLREAVAVQYLGRRRERGESDWALEQVRRHDWTAVLEAAGELARFDSRPWVGQVDVPTAVVLTERDRLVAPQRQARLHAAIPGASLHRVDGDHDAVVAHPDRFLPALLAALERVARPGAAPGSRHR